MSFSSPSDCQSTDTCPSTQFLNSEMARSNSSIPDNTVRMTDSQSNDVQNSRKNRASIASTSINFDVLEGHQYEVVANPESENGESNYNYICKYDGCGRTFTKTYNLVYHFRVHTNEKPFQCKVCLKEFTQKGNHSRHIETHQAKSIKDRKTHSCAV